MEGYTSYSKQMASITPSSTNAVSYTPSNTAAAACPTADSTWEVSTNLPPTPNEELCQCMSASVACSPKLGLSAEDAGSLINTVCGLSIAACAGISANGTTGLYGIYSPCDTTDQLAYALNAYYKAQSSKGNAASACNFNGSATLQSATTPTSCSSLLSSASSHATVTSKGAAAGGHLYHTQGISNGVQAGLYLFVAFVTAMLMVILWRTYLIHVSYVCLVSLLIDMFICLYLCFKYMP